MEWIVPLTDYNLVTSYSATDALVLQSQALDLFV